MDEGGVRQAVQVLHAAGHVDGDAHALLPGEGGDTAAAVVKQVTAQCTLQLGGRGGSGEGEWGGGELSEERQREDTPCSMP